SGGSGARDARDDRDAKAPGPPGNARKHGDPRALGARIFSAHPTNPLPTPPRQVSTTETRRYARRTDSNRFGLRVSVSPCLRGRGPAKPASLEPSTPCLESG